MRPFTQNSSGPTDSQRPRRWRQGGGERGRGGGGEGEGEEEEEEQEEEEEEEVVESTRIVTLLVHHYIPEAFHCAAGDRMERAILAPPMACISWSTSATSFSSALIPRGRRW